LMRDLGPRIDDKTIAMTIDALRLRWECDEAVEGIDAFFEKRKASWAL
jgi:methylglutaconyl-CoA hydratase